MKPSVPHALYYFFKAFKKQKIQILKDISDIILFFNLLVLNISRVLFDDIMLKICSLVKLMDSERH